MVRYNGGSFWSDPQNKPWIIGMLFFVGLGGVMAYFTFHTKPVNVKVIAHTWQWNIEVQRFKAVRYEREIGYPPEGAYDTHTWEEDDSYQDSDGEWVHDSTTYSDYTLDEWAHERWLVAGNNDKKPHWPSTDSIRRKPANVPLTIHGRWERQGATSQKFHLLLVEEAGNRNWKHEIADVKRWLRVKKGEVHRAHVNHMNWIRRFEELEQADGAPEGFPDEQ